MPMFAACGECKPTHDPPAEPMAQGDKPGQQLSEREKQIRELIYLAAITQGLMNEELPADGSVHGIIGGKDKDGIDSAAVQAVMAGAAITINTIASLGFFEKLLKSATKAGVRIVIKTTGPLSEAIAEQLNRMYGVDIAHALAENGTVGPYRLMKRFTDNLGHAWEAHHLLEVKWFKQFPFGNPDLGPAVLLTKAQHDEITAALRVAMKDVTEPMKVWEGYVLAYGQKHPEWLEFIRPYFGK
jgi:hypothetical protein